MFQQLELDSYIGDPIPNTPGAKRGPVPIIRLYGLTQEKHSVLAHVRGFHPFLYVPAPAGFDPDEVPMFRKALNSKIQAQVRNQSQIAPEYVLSVEVMEKESIYGYSTAGKTPFLCIYLALHAHMSIARRILEHGFDYGRGEVVYQSYESNIGYELKFMIESSIVGCNWIELPAGMYSLRSPGSASSHAQIEVDVAWDLLTSHAPEGEWLNVAPYRVLSFDIECMGRKGVFPEAEIDPVIQIASQIWENGASKPLVRTVMTLDTCAPIAGAQVLSFRTERELLEAWKEFVVATDPDVLTGYNIVNFDLPYLIDRAAALQVESFPWLGRVRGEKTTMRSTTFSSKAYGTRENKDIRIHGRVQFDMLVCIRRDYKLRSYSLNAVSANFLGEQKEDVHYSAISDLQRGNSETRHRLAVYCLKDAILPQRLLIKLLSLVNYIEMARVTGVPLSWLLTRGQQIKVVSQLYRKAGTLDYVIPAMRSAPSDEQYEGATVLDPITGFYDEPITTLDFSSLYPSIMMAHNLCYTTLLSPKVAASLGPTDFVKTPTSDLFVKKHVRQGVLPIILKELLDARKRAKKAMKAETDPFRKGVLNGRQLALKISANSVYGFTGATVGKLPCLPISSSTTSFGRRMIDQTKTLIEEKYTVANGYEKDAVVVYGDTDSVMVKFGLPDIASSMELGAEAAAYVNEHFVDPIALEFEYVGDPFLLLAKKRYAAVKYGSPDDKGKMYARGLETVRRDTARIVTDVLNVVLRRILFERNVSSAVQYVQDKIGELLRGETDISQLVVSKSLSKAPEEYDNVGPHVALAMKMMKRDPGSAPVVGDRVAYVVIRGPQNSKVYERAEDPLYVLENSLSIDPQYYIEQQLKKPLLRVMGPILPSTDILFVGEHTRKIKISAPSVGGLSRFTVRTERCLGCKAALPASNPRPVCSHCASRTPEIYATQLAKHRELELTFARLWSTCMACTGLRTQDIQCVNSDCVPVFYARHKVRKDLGEAAVALGKLEAYDW